MTKSTQTETRRVWNPYNKMETRQLYMQTLEERGRFGLDLSPGDEVCAWAHKELAASAAEVERLRYALTRIAEHCENRYFTYLAEIARAALTPPPSEEQGKEVES